MRPGWRPPRVPYAGSRGEQAEAIGGSTHTLPLRLLSEYLSSSMGCRVSLLGIQPAEITLGAPLSPSVGEAVEFRRGGWPPCWPSIRLARLSPRCDRAPIPLPGIREGATGGRLMSFRLLPKSAFPAWVEHVRKEHRVLAPVPHNGAHRFRGDRSRRAGGPGVSDNHPSAQEGHAACSREPASFQYRWRPARSGLPARPHRHPGRAHLRSARHPAAGSRSSATGYADQHYRPAGEHAADRHRVPAAVQPALVLQEHGHADGHRAGSTCT